MIFNRKRIINNSNPNLVLSWKHQEIVIHRTCNQCFKFQPTVISYNTINRKNLEIKERRTIVISNKQKQNNITTIVFYFIKLIISNNEILALLEIQNNGEFLDNFKQTKILVKMSDLSGNINFFRGGLIFNVSLKLFIHFSRFWKFKLLLKCLFDYPSLGACVI